MPSTTIRLDTETRDELLARGRMGESFDDVVRRLLNATRGLDVGESAAVRRPAVKPLFTHLDRK
jgi:predicted CopG family antitoxin